MSEPPATAESTRLARNARDLERELEWLAQVLDVRFKRYFAPDDEPAVWELPDPPDFAAPASPYAEFVARHALSKAERLTLIVALTPIVRPRLLDIFFIKNSTFDRKFTEFGGLFGGPDGDFTPTGETVAFILGGEDLATRFELQTLFEPEHLFTRDNVLHLAPDESLPPLKKPLRCSDEYVRCFTTGRPYRPDFSTTFPARYIETRLEWQDLVLHPGTRQQIEEIKTWLQHGDELMHQWGMAPKLRPGYRSLFYGPPGTGKTMTACLLGKSTGRDVYKVDLSLVVSKYIGETEKNLSQVFAQAQNREWILFFDEADALFGKRGATRHAHDRYANQEVSYLLQRVETFDGVAILASNRRDDLDAAFARRFESIIYFPMPRPEERLRLWEQGFPARMRPPAADELQRIALDHTLSGSSIMNVIRYASLQAISKRQDAIAVADVLQGIRLEYAKEGRGV